MVGGGNNVTGDYLVTARLLTCAHLLQLTYATNHADRDGLWAALHTSPLMGSSNIMSATNDQLPFSTAPNHNSYEDRSTRACNRGRLRQSEIRTQLCKIGDELSTLEDLLETATLQEDDRLNIQDTIRTKKLEQIGLERGLHKLVSGQLRQRKFREKLKLKALQQNF